MWTNLPLEQAIATCVARGQTLFCFITDQSDKTKEWENNSLASPELQSFISRYGLPIRIILTSPEANLLFQYVPFPRVSPAIVLFNSVKGISYFADKALYIGFESTIRKALSEGMNEFTVEELHNIGGNPGNADIHSGRFDEQGRPVYYAGSTDRRARESRQSQPPPAGSTLEPTSTAASPDPLPSAPAPAASSPAPAAASRPSAPAVEPPPIPTTPSIPAPPITDSSEPAHQNHSPPTLPAASASTETTPSPEMSDSDSTPTAAQKGKGRAQPEITTPTPPPPPQSSPSSPPPPPLTNPTPSYQQDRLARIQAQQRALSATEKAKKRQAAAALTPEQKEAREKSKVWAEGNQRRKAKQEEERQRILKAFENDRLERKWRDDRKKEVRGALAGGELGDQEQNGLAESVEAPVAAPKTVNEVPAMCMLQLRLPDGSSTRQSYPRDATIADAIRPSLTVGQPYVFKQILTPKPARQISDSEEHLPLSELGFARTETLVLVPAPSTAYSAYPSGTGSSAAVTNLGARISGIAQTVLVTLLAPLTLAFGLLVRGLRAFLGTGVRAVAEVEDSQTARALYGRGTALVDEEEREGMELRERKGKGKGDGKGRGKEEYYNGNSTSFESRDDP